jgi:ankyrin repeat protein
LKRQQAADSEALARIRENYPRWRNLPEEQVAASPFALADAQLVIARKYGFASWSKLRSHVKTLEAASSTAEAVASLRDAAGRGDLARLKALLDAHPELIDERGGEGVRTPLHEAVFGNRGAAVKLLLERGANPNIRCEGDNAYPLHFAVEKHRFPIIRLLVEHGADNVRDDPKTSIDSTSGYTPLHAAAFNGNVSAIEVLMKHGADVRAREEKYHGTPAGWADYAGHKEARDLILRGPIDIIEAIQYDMAQRVKAVLEEDPAALDRVFGDYGLVPWDAEAWYTPLAYAVTRGREKIVRLLIERGAVRALRSPKGETLSEIAQKAGHREIALILDGAAGGDEARS